MPAQAVVEWPRAGLGLDVTRKPADQAISSTSLTNVTDLVFPVVANSVYSFEFLVPFSSVALTTGIGLAVSCPASPALLSYQAEIPFAADGVDATWIGSGTASGDTILSTGVVAINTVYLARLTGVLRNGANAGNLQVQARSEVNASAVTVKSGAWGILWSG